MPYFEQSVFLAGLLLGLSSSVHCLAMCSGVAASFSLAGQGAVAVRQPLVARTLSVHAGRIMTYTAAGGAVAGAGSFAAFAGNNPAIANAVLRWIAAAFLAWTGAVIAGFAPSMLAPEKARAAAAWFSSRIGSASFLRRGGFVAAGIVWGFMPCGMVYSALFYAMLTGTPLRGGLTMLGFGLGTALPLAAVGLGIPFIGNRAAAPAMRLVFGLAVIAVGVAGIAFSTREIAILCGIRP